MSDNLCGVKIADFSPRAPAIVLPIAPMAKPRQTQSDRWKKRPVVVRYRDWCDQVRALMGARTLPDAFWAVFGIPLPPSYGRARRASLAGAPHVQRPDADNLLKALMDACLADDSHVWDVRATKVWHDGPGFIRVEVME